MAETACPQAPPPLLTDHHYHSNGNCGVVTLAFHGGYTGWKEVMLGYPAGLVFEGLKFSKAEKTAGEIEGPGWWHCGKG